MSSFNRVIMTGNLTRDPEYKQLGSGQAVCRLGLASNRQYKNRQSGSMVQEVCYIDIDVWGPQAESCKQFLQKGRPVLIEGRLKLDSWKDNEGQTRSKHSIVADRVIFLSNANQAQDDEMNDESGLDREILEKLNGIKKSKEKESEDKIVASLSPKVKKKKLDEEEIEFKDEPPFEDDLPF